MDFLILLISGFILLIIYIIGYFLYSLLIRKRKVKVYLTNKINAFTFSTIIHIRGVPTKGKVDKLVKKDDPSVEIYHYSILDTSS